jgi:cytochrome c2
MEARARGHPMNRDPRSGAQTLYAWGIHGFPGLVWLVSGLLVMTLLPAQLKYGVPIWKAGELAGIQPVLASMPVAVLVAALLADRQRDASGAVRWLPALALAAAAYVPALLYLVLLSPAYPRSIPLLAMLVGAVVIVVPLLLRRRQLYLLTCVAAVVALALLGVGIGVRSTDPWSMNALARRMEKQQTSVTALPTTLYPLRVKAFHGFLNARVPGGGIAAFNQGYLVATGEGFLFHVKRDPVADTLESRRLKVSVPIDFDEFFSETRQPDRSPTGFRVTDLLVEEKDGSVLIFAAHNYWKREQQCTVLRVSMLSARIEDVAGDRPVADWRTLYDAGPCQATSSEGQGGRLVRLPDGRLLLSIGDQGKGFAQDASSSYGKTVAIDVATGEARNFTSGHRNPQGLAVASNGDIWLTEHGPHGGDELNRLVPGANYGWPLVSYGLPYDFEEEVPFTGIAGSHEGFEKPAFAWLPSIGISNLIEVTGGLFTEWRQDLLIASLVKTTLWRARLVGQRVEYVEEIKLDRRIRDIIEDPAGRIVLWTDDHALQFIEPLTAGAGPGGASETQMAAIAFARCAACHVATAGASSGIGPNLHGVIGRAVAGDAGYAYSNALRSAGGTWDEERLDHFLADPQAFAPGTRPEMQPLPDAAERRRIITHLKTLH